MTSARDPREIPQPFSAILDDVEAFVGDHLGEAALVLIADGAGDLISARARAHAESCPRCGAAIGEQALAASELHAAFEAMAPAERERLAAHGRAPADKSALVLRHVSRAGRAEHGPARDGARRATRTGGAIRAGGEIERATDATDAVEEPSSTRRGARGGAWWIAGGLVVAALASSPSIAGIGRAISNGRDAMLVVFAVGVQLAESLRVDPGRLGVVQATASWTATLAMICVGTWIAWRAPRGSAASGTERAEAKGT